MDWAKGNLYQNQYDRRKRRYFWSLSLVCLSVLVVFLSGCASDGGQPPASGTTLPGGANNSEPSGSVPDKINVVVTFDAIRSFVDAVGGDRVQISTIVPAGAELHDFEPKARDLAALSKAQVLAINGLGIEPWAEQAVQSAGNPGLIVVDTSVGADVIEVGENHAGHKTNSAQGDDHAHAGRDPHLWLSLSGARLQAQNIEKALSALDPANQAYYQANLNRFTSALQKLQDRFIPEIAAAPRRVIVTGHAAFAYLCRDLGLEQKSVENTFAEGEPTARQLAELVDYCREHRVTTIFAEQMASPEVSQTLANEVGAQVAILYTLEHAVDHLSYLERQEKNLLAISASLKDCDNQDNN